MPRRFGIICLLLVIGVGCRSNDPPEKLKEEAEHGSEDSKKSKYRWGPAAPEPPLVPSAVPQIPEQPAAPMMPGDGPKLDKPAPDTSNPAEPK